MPRHYYLIKSEPYKYSFDALLRDGKTLWDGVRNYEARNSLRAMKLGDLLLFYHSNEGKEIVGVARVAREAYQDPTTDGDWSVVDIEPVTVARRPLTLAEIRVDPKLADIALLRRSRLSVVPVSKAHFDHILRRMETKIA